MGRRKTAAAEIVPLIQSGERPRMAPCTEFNGMVGVIHDSARLAPFIPVGANDRVQSSRVDRIVAPSRGGGDDLALLMRLLA